MTNARRYVQKLYDSETYSEKRYLSVLMCSQQSDVGVEMRRLIDGNVSLQELANLATARAAFILVPITEESIEGKHGIDNKLLLKYTNWCHKLVYKFTANKKNI